MVAFFQRHIAAWMDGTEGLSDGEYRVYDVVCNLIYLNDGPIVAHETGIAGRCRQHILTFRRNLAKLIESGKLVIENEKITNRRTSTELGRIQSRRRNPPSDPRPTSAQSPPMSVEVAGGFAGGPADKPLKNKDQRHINGEKLPSSLLSSPSTDSDSLFRLEVDEEERSSRWSFDEFWNPYPNKVGKNDARKSFERVRRSKSVTFENLMIAWRRYIAKTDDRPWCNPATWLNQGRWEDQPASGGRDGNARSGSGASGSACGGFASFAVRRAREASGA